MLDLIENLRDKLLIFCAGGHASKVVSCAKQNKIKIAGYISTEKPGTEINGLQVLGDIDYFLSNKKLHPHKLHIAIGENSVRCSIYESLGKHSENLCSVISKSAYADDDVVIESGTSVMPGAVVHNFAVIGKCCIIDTGAIVEHHVRIGSFVNISPGAILCGSVVVEEGAIIGAGAVVIEKVRIGKNSLIGAGSVVVNDIPEDSIAIGNPAKVIKKRNFKDRYLK